MHPKIEIALDHSPKHKNDIAAALASVGRNDIAGAARIVKEKCEEIRIIDFPNPFPADTREHKQWAAGWWISGSQWTAAELEDMQNQKEKSSTTRAESKDRNWSVIKKADIAYVLNTEFGQSLSAKDVKKMTHDKLVVLAEKLANG